MRDQPFVAVTAFLALLMVEVCGWSAADEAGGAVSADDRILLREPALTESSGLATSRVREHRFWSHNDSGGDSRLFAFDDTGRKTGQCQLESAGSIDWEDIATFVDGGVARLLVADCGDNLASRESITLYVLDEPDPDSAASCKIDQTLLVSYSDGPRNCEAIAVDPERRQIILVTKSALPAAGVYVIPLPPRGQAGETKTTAQRVGTVALPMVTAMDIHPKSGDLWLINYFQAFHFRCHDRHEPVHRQLAELPSPLDLPRWKQIEAVAVDDLHQVWVTSEGSPAPMTRLSQQPTQPSH